MKDFAKASRLLIQPSPGAPDRFLDPTHPQPKADEGPQDFDIAKDFTREPSTSPYGDFERWDIFWLGHCGSQFPRSTDRYVPLGRAVNYADETVPEPQHVTIQFGGSELVRSYPAHTRVVS